jgi:hypothetical protein
LRFDFGYATAYVLLVIFLALDAEISPELNTPWDTAPGSGTLLLQYMNQFVR